MSDTNKIERHTIPIHAADGVTSELLLTLPANAQIGLLWIPALGVPARHYEAFADALAARGIASARHEWRGLGSSSVRAGRDSNWGYRELLADVDDSLVAARETAPQLRWLVGGHSLGSQFATMAFALHDDIAGLVVVAGGMPYWKNFPGVRGIGIRTLFALGPPIGKVFGYFPGRRFGFAGNEARHVIRDWARTGRSGTYFADGVDIDIEAALASRSGSALGIWLDDDWFTPRRSFDHLLDKLGRADVTRQHLSQHDFDGKPADHFGWIRYSEPVVDQIARWIDGELIPATATATSRDSSESESP